MQVLVFITLFVSINVVWARPSENEDVVDTKRVLGSSESELLEAIAKLHDLERTVDAIDELEPIFMVLQSEFKKMENFTKDEYFEYCGNKLNVTGDDDSDPLDMVSCLLECVAELNGFWKDGNPSGFLTAWKQFSDIIMEKYSDIAGELVAFARVGQNCIKPGPPCMGFIPVMECLTKDQPE